MSDRTFVEGQRGRTPSPGSCTTALDTLRAARDWFAEDPMRVCYNAFALDADNNGILCSALRRAKVCKACSDGALIMFSATEQVRYEAETFFLHAIGKPTDDLHWLFIWHDDESAKDGNLLAAFDRAVALAEEAQEPST